MNGVDVDSVHVRSDDGLLMDDWPSLSLFIYR